jgi:hypothetical protein
MNKKLIYILIPILLISSLAIYFLFINKDESIDLTTTQQEQKTSQEDSPDRVDKEREATECQSLGEECEGGLLAYVDDQGTKLIVSAVNNAEDIQWGCRGQLLNITSREYSAGKENTQALVNWHQGWQDPWFTAPESSTGYCHEKNDGTVAANICNDLELNGFSDWYLPSIDELDYIYENVHKNGQGGFGDSECWSSSESSEGSAWIKSFATRGDEYGYQKSFNRSVRCVRSI